MDLIKQRKLKLFGHICRINDNRLIKTLMLEMVEGDRPRERRPAKRWSDDIQGGAKNGATYLIANILKIPWPNCMEIGELLQYYMLNTVINFLFKNFIALWRHLAKTQLLCDAQIYLYNVNKRQTLNINVFFPPPCSVVVRCRRRFGWLVTELTGLNGCHGPWVAKKKEENHTLKCVLTMINLIKFNKTNKFKTYVLEAN